MAISPQRVIRYTSCLVLGSDVKSSRPKWPRGQNFGPGLEVQSRFAETPTLTLTLNPNLTLTLISENREDTGLEALASASRFWPRPGLDFFVLLCNRAFFVQKSRKIPEFS